jgi:hypothetical protein
MINFLKQLIEFIKNVTNYAMKNKVFRYLYKAFLFISSLYIVKIYLIFWRYTRKIWSLLSAILLLVIADFNISNIITAFSLILSSIPSYINNAVVNLWCYINNIFSNNNIINTKSIHYPINRNEISDIITDNNYKVEDEPFPGRSLRRIYTEENHQFESDTFLQKYGYYIFGSVVTIIIVGGSYYFYGDDIKTYITPYIYWLFNKSSDRDRGSSDSTPQNDNSSFNAVYDHENFLSEVLSDEKSGSDISSNEPYNYMKSPNDSSDQTNIPHPVNNSVQTDESSYVNSSVQTDESSYVNSSVQTDESSYVNNSVQTDESSYVNSSVQTDRLPNVDSSIQTDITSPVENQVQTYNILDDTVKNEIQQIFVELKPQNLEDIVNTIIPKSHHDSPTEVSPSSPQSTTVEIPISPDSTSIDIPISPNSSEENLEDIVNTIISKSHHDSPTEVSPSNPQSTSVEIPISPDSTEEPLIPWNRAVKFAKEVTEKIFIETEEETKSKKKGFKFWNEASSSSSHAEDSDYSPISPLEESPWRSFLSSSFMDRFDNTNLLKRFNEIILEQQTPDELLKASNEFNKLDTNKIVNDWLIAKSNNITAIDFINTKTYIVYPITKKLLLNLLEST